MILPQQNILIVEDDLEIARIVADHLRKAGFHTVWASTGKEGWEEFKKTQFDLVLVDLMMPEMDGFSLSRMIRLESDVPLLIISAKHEDENKVLGLDSGADDYITKPFSLEELTARVNSHLRRYRRYENRGEGGRKKIFLHGLTIDFTNRLVQLEGEQVLLTAKELELLFLLAKNPLRTFSKPELYEHIWQQEDMDGNNTVTVHVKGLRAKLKDESKSPKFIQTVWGSGYRFIGEETT